MAAGARTGRDKLTLVLPAAVPALRPVGGAARRRKHRQAGPGVVPITGEAGDAPIGPDRVIARWAQTKGRTKGQTEGRPSRGSKRARDLPRADTIGRSTWTRVLGGEFFRWEFATAPPASCSASTRSTSRTCSRRRTPPARCSTYVAQRRLPVPDPTPNRGRADHAERCGEPATLKTPARSFLQLVQPLGLLRAARLPATPDDEGFAGVLETCGVTWR